MDRSALLLPLLALLALPGSPRALDASDAELQVARRCRVFAVSGARSFDGRSVPADAETTEALVRRLRAAGAFDPRSPCVVRVKVQELAGAEVSAWELEVARLLDPAVLRFAGQSGLVAGKELRRRDEVQARAERFVDEVVLPLARAAADGPGPADGGGGTGRPRPGPP